MSTSPSSTLVDRDGAVRNDPWLFLSDEPIPSAGDIVVPLARAEEAARLNRRGRLGVRVAPADQVEALQPILKKVALVAVDFPAFRDGRGFSSARLLRDRFDFKGELRATGAVLEDQIFYLIRCGFDSFEVATPHAEAAVASAARTYSLAYQAASDAREPVFRRRLAQRTDQ
ncbi:MAG: DUF934 domain-containing protein [Hyphomonadaceae bacterium]|nr:DUF934 domain-containing protein [Hyphomonadaceae bacterium]